MYTLNIYGCLSRKTSACTAEGWLDMLSSDQHSAENSNIYPTVCLLLGLRALSPREQWALTSDTTQSCRSAATCEVASTPVWTFLLSHRNKKPYHTGAHMGKLTQWPSDWCVTCENSGLFCLSGAFIICHYLKNSWLGLKRLIRKPCFNHSLSFSVLQSTVLA